MHVHFERKYNLQKYKHKYFIKASHSNQFAIVENCTCTTMEFRTRWEFQQNQIFQNGAYGHSAVTRKEGGEGWDQTWQCGSHCWISRTSSLSQGDQEWGQCRHLVQTWTAPRRSSQWREWWWTGDDEQDSFLQIKEPQLKGKAGGNEYLPSKGAGHSTFHRTRTDGAVCWILGGSAINYCTLGFSLWPQVCGKEFSVLCRVLE